MSLRILQCSILTTICLTIVGAAQPQTNQTIGSSISMAPSKTNPTPTSTPVKKGTKRKATPGDVPVGVNKSPSKKTDWHDAPTLRRFITALVGSLESTPGVKLNYACRCLLSLFICLDIFFVSFFYVFNFASPLSLECIQSNGLIAET